MFGGRDEQARPVGARGSMALMLQVFLINRGILTLISLLTSKLFYDVPGRDHGLLALWHRWDVLWFVQIADHGYTWSAPPIQSDVAFFPLFPFAMHVLSLISPFSAYGAGLLIANLSFAATLYFFHRLLLRDFEAAVAERAVYYLGLFPTALFFYASYSEALYLLCCIGCIYALRLRRWWVAGVCGMGAALTRQLGLLLVVPFAMEALEYYRHRPRDEFERYSPWLALSLAPAGLIAYMVYLQARFGDAFLFLRAQAAWHRGLALPWEGIALDMSRIVHLPGHFSAHTQGALEATSWLDISFLGLFLILIGLGVRWLPRSYSVYGGACMVAILVAPATGQGQPLALLSISRFELTIFPPFIVLALLGRSPVVDRVVQAISVSLLVLFTILFVRGRWVA
ncbi:MAG TPA: mannosyltransferase family protein [Chloroflexota bacterium]|nr:mannosyltransferase family protein [Chloroflexota bacterium]